MPMLQHAVQQNMAWLVWPAALALETAKNGIVIVDPICPENTETALTEGAIENITQKTD